MLAADPITFDVGADSFVLRPTLRAAIRLERTLSLPKAIAALEEGYFTVIADIVKLGLSSGSAFPSAGGPELALSHWFDDARTACLAFVLALYDLGQNHDHFGEDTEREPDPQPKFQTPAEVFADLYRVGTGTLGWTPEATLDAAPIEIVEAARGRHTFIRDILGAVFGKPEGESDIPARPDTRRDPDAGAVLRGLSRAV